MAAQTGVTRFTQMNNNWLYSKNESLEPHQLQEYTHLLVEAKSKYSPNLRTFSNTHIILDSVESFSQIALNYKLIPPVKIKTKPSIFILERKDFRDYPKGHMIETMDSHEYVEHDSNQISTEETTFSHVGNNIENVDVDPNTATLPPVIEADTHEDIVQDDLKSDQILENNITPEDTQKANKAFDELKSLRQERKRRAIAKIKSETRREVVASAKEKLRDIMRRHQHIAHELTENIISDANEINTVEETSRTDILPEETTEELVINIEDLDKENNIRNDNFETPENGILSDETAKPLNRTDENINAIVDEVITRLIERKIYDDKTKPEDIKPEDRQIIQQIVEEVVYEKMNYSSSIKL